MGRVGLSHRNPQSMGVVAYGAPLGVDASIGVNVHCCPIIAGLAIAN